MNPFPLPCSFFFHFSKTDYFLLIFSFGFSDNFFSQIKINIFLISRGEGKISDIRFWMIVLRVYYVYDTFSRRGYSYAKIHPVLKSCLPVLYFVNSL